MNKINHFSDVISEFQNSGNVFQNPGKFPEFGLISEFQNSGKTSRILRGMVWSIGGDSRRDENKFEMPGESNPMGRAAGRWTGAQQRVLESRSVVDV